MPGTIVGARVVADGALRGDVFDLADYEDLFEEKTSPFAELLKGGRQHGSHPSPSSFARPWTASDNRHDQSECTHPSFPALQHPDGATLVVGHSLGAIVALELVAAIPTYSRGVLLEDPPALDGNRAAGDIAGDIGREVMRARTDPHSAIAAMLAGHPGWNRRDARSMLEGRLMTDPQIAQLSPGDITWDLPALVSDCPVAVALVATRGGSSALFDPDRSELLRLLPRERVTEIPGSHHVHLDDPARWVDAVDAFGAFLI